MRNRLLIKFSGEVFGGESGQGIKAYVLTQIAKEIKTIVDLGVRVGVVIGAGNIFRGETLSKIATESGLRRDTADHIGMLGTTINGLAFRDAIEHCGLMATVFSPGGIQGITECYSSFGARELIENGGVAIFSGGTGNPFFTTDTAACLRASELGIGLVLKATKVDGVYNNDPLEFPEAKKFKKLTFDDAIRQNLKVMDLAALDLCQKNGLQVIVYNMTDSEALTKIAHGEIVGTLIHCSG